MLAIRTKRSTSCIVYNCKCRQKKTRPDENTYLFYLPRWIETPSRSQHFGSVWCCSVLQVYVNTMTLQHFLCLSSFVLHFLPNQITSLLLICDSTSRHSLICFIRKCSGLLVKVHRRRAVRSTLVLCYDLLGSQARFIQVLSEMVPQKKNVLLSNSLNYFKWLFLNYFKT